MNICYYVWYICYYVMHVFIYFVSDFNNVRMPIAMHSLCLCYAFKRICISIATLTESA